MNDSAAMFWKVVRRVLYPREPGLKWDVTGNETGRINLDIGCGNTKKKGVFGLDILLEGKPDIVANLERGLPLKSDSVDCIYASHVLEHVEKLQDVLSEIYRILQPEGCVRIFVPHFSNPYGHSDYTHKRLFGLFTFYYFTPYGLQKHWRKVPNYQPGFLFEVTYERLHFYSPLSLAWPFVVCLEFLVNSNRFVRALYEYHFCYWFPVYGIQVEMRPIGKVRN